MLDQIKVNYQFTYKDSEFRASDSECLALINGLDETGLWTDLDYTVDHRNAWCWTGHINRIATIASNDKFLSESHNRASFMTALNAFLSQPRTNDNWWHNQIGLPMACGNLYLLQEDILDDGQKKALLTYVEQGSLHTHPENFRLWFGSNLLWGAFTTLTHALIAGDMTIALPTLEALKKELTMKNGREGIQEDFSFFQHQTQFYNGGYGKDFMIRFATIVYSLKGTDYQFPSENLNLLGGYIISGMRYCIRNNHLDFLTVGREISRPDALRVGEYRKSLYLLLHVDEMPCRDVIQEQFASLTAEMYSLRSDKFFSESNYYSSRITTSHIGCRGTSPHRSLGETINGENQLSANLYAGGATCIMVDGKEYDNIFPLWDFSHVPGTTAPEETDDEIEAKYAHWHGTKGANTYCKGFSHNNVGILYQDVNFDGVTGVISRFFINGMMIALGADLSCDKDKNLTTTLNQCRLYDKVLTEEDRLPTNWAYQGRIAYCTLDQQPLTITVEQKEGNWSRINDSADRVEKDTVFTVGISHGIHPEHASYAYLVIPAVSASNAAQRIQDELAQITVLRNDHKVQAIRYKDKVYCVFHKNDTLQLAQYDQLISSGPGAYIL